MKIDGITVKAVITGSIFAMESIKHTHTHIKRSQVNDISFYL